MDAVFTVFQLGAQRRGDLEQDHQPPSQIPVVHGILSGAWRDRACRLARSDNGALGDLVVRDRRGVCLCRRDCILCPQNNAAALRDMAYVRQHRQHPDVYRHLARLLSRQSGLMVKASRQQ